MKALMPALAVAAVARALLSPASASCAPPPGKAGGTTITANRIEYDYKESVILFEENVKVADPQYTMTASRVIVTLQHTNDVRQVKAIGDVRLVSGDRVASGNEALYTRADGKIVITGNAVLKRAGDSLEGKCITIWIDEQRMVCVPAVLTLDGGTVKTAGKNKNGKGKRLLP